MSLSRAQQSRRTPVTEHVTAEGLETRKQGERIISLEEDISALEDDLLIMAQKIDAQDTKIAELNQVVESLVEEGLAE